jgi:hypothetical protein
MKVKTPQKVANLPAVARCGGNEKRLICMSLRAPTIIATSFIKKLKKRKLETFKKVLGNWWQRWQSSRAPVISVR